MASSKKWRRLLKFTGPALFVFFLVKIVDFKAVTVILAEIRPDMVLVSAALFPVLTAGLTLRWWLICKQLGMTTSFGTLTGIYYTAWFLGILPVTGTNAVAKFLYLKNSGERASATAVSLVFDKVLDIVGWMLFGLIGILYLPKGIIDPEALITLWGGALLAGIIFLVFSKCLWQKIKTALNRHLNKRVKSISSSVESDLSELWATFDFKAMCAQICLVIINNLLRGIILYVLAVSLGINISVIQAMVCRSLIGVVNFIPISNSGLGTRDAVLILVLPLWGVSPDAALALGFTAFLWTIFSKAAGVAFWFKHPMPLKKMGTSE